MTSKEFISILGKELMENTTKEIFDYFNGYANECIPCELELSWDRPYGKECPLGTFNYPCDVTVYLDAVAELASKLISDSEEIKDIADTALRMLKRILIPIIIHELCHADIYNDKMTQHQEFYAGKNTLRKEIESVADQDAYRFYIDNKDTIEEKFNMGELNYEKPEQYPLEHEISYRSDHYIEFKMMINFLVSSAIGFPSKEDVKLGKDRIKRAVYFYRDYDCISIDLHIIQCDRSSHNVLPIKKVTDDEISYASVTKMCKFVHDNFSKYGNHKNSMLIGVDTDLKNNHFDIYYKFIIIEKQNDYKYHEKSDTFTIRKDD